MFAANFQQKITSPSVPVSTIIQITKTSCGSISSLEGETTIMPNNLEAMRAKFDEKLERVRAEKAQQEVVRQNSLIQLYELIISRIQSGIYEIAGEGNVSPYIVVKTERLNEEDSVIICS